MNSGNIRPVYRVHLDMRYAGMAVMALVAASVTAAELDSKVVRLISPDAWLVAGHDVERYGSFRLSELVPLPVNRIRDGAGIHEDAQVRQLMVVLGEEEGNELMVFRGAAWPVDEEARFVPLDELTGIMGLHDYSAVEGAIARWQAGEDAGGEIADAARDLSASYDTWLIARRPLDHIEGDRRECTGWGFPCTLDRGPVTSRGTRAPGTSSRLAPRA